MKIEINMRKADPKKEPEAYFVAMLDIDGKKTELPGLDMDLCFQSAMTHINVRKPQMLEKFEKIEKEKEKKAAEAKNTAEAKKEK